jgi:AAA domain/UvrD-like helicase C-terminal domain
LSELRPDPDHDAVCAAEGRHLVVVAPPGTGKTCLSIRLAGVHAAHLDPEQRVLLLTFSNQARVQLETEAARQLTPDVRAQIEVTNYHRFFYRSVRVYLRALGLPLQADLWSSESRFRAMAAVDEQLAKQLRKDEILHSLAEFRFPEFRDDRTPDAELLERLLAVVDAENAAGRMVFDDLGALFWRLSTTFPAVDGAYRHRYPVVIADEHQDASELQDALVRRLGEAQLIILADPMQLIYGFRGSRDERLQRHRDECDQEFELHTPHRWHGSEETGRWLLAVRERLLGRDAAAEPPSGLELVTTPAKFGFNAMKPKVKYAVSNAFANSARSVAVLAFTNGDVAQLRAYLTTQGMYPRQVGGPADFEDARADIEQLPLLDDPVTLARHAISRVEGLVPSLSSVVLNQVKGRLKTGGVDVSGAGAEARSLLEPLAPLYEHGGRAYVECVVGMLEVCAERGYHLPRIEAVRALRETAQALASERSEVELDDLLVRYAARAAAASHAAPRYDRGLFVMTAHQAKGREFDAVIIVHASARFLPDNEAARRLFYVAVTRGAKRWTLIYPEGEESPLIAHLTP